MKPSDESAGKSKLIPRDELVAHLFGDADDPDAVEAALAESEELCLAFDDLRRTLDLVDAEPIPPRPADYGARVWEEIEGRLGTSQTNDSRTNVVSLADARRSRRDGGSPRWLALAAAALVLLGAGFLLGRLGTMTSQAPDAQPSNAAADDLPALSDEARGRLLAAALTDHLGRSERLLAEVVNASASGRSEAELEQAWATELLVSNRVYRRAAERAGQKRIASLLAELEPVLLELAHASGEGEEFDQLKRRVDERGLLFKVRVTEQRLGSSGPRTSSQSL